MCDNLQTITYKGKEKEWNRIEKGNLGKKVHVEVKNGSGQKNFVDADELHEQMQKKLEKEQQ